MNNATQDGRMAQAARAACSGPRCIGRCTGKIGIFAAKDSRSETNRLGSESGIDRPRMQSL